MQIDKMWIRQNVIGWRDHKRNGGPKIMNVYIKQNESKTIIEIDHNQINLSALGLRLSVIKEKEHE